jgi:hypothetical protein
MKWEFTSWGKLLGLILLGPVSDEVAEEWRKLHNDKLYCLDNARWYNWQDGTCRNHDINKKYKQFWLENLKRSFGNLDVYGGKTKLQRNRLWRCRCNLYWTALGRDSGVGFYKCCNEQLYFIMELLFYLKTLKKKLLHVVLPEISLKVGTHFLLCVCLMTSINAKVTLHGMRMTECL